MTEVCIVGAGLAGLSIVSSLEGEKSVKLTVVDQYYTVGGRMSTRGSFDTGCQLFNVTDPFFDRIVRGWLDGGLVSKWNRKTRHLKSVDVDQDLYLPVGGANALTQALYCQNMDSTTATFLFNHHLPLNSIKQLSNGKLQLNFAPQHDGTPTPVIETSILVLTSPAISVNLLSPPPNCISPKYNATLCLLVTYSKSMSEFPDAILKVDGAIDKIVSQRARGLVKEGENLVVFFSNEFSAQHLKDGYSQDLVQQMWTETQSVLRQANANDWLDPVEYILKRWEYATIKQGISNSESACQRLQLPNGSTVILAGDGYASTNDFSVYSGVERAVLSGMSVAEALLKACSLAEASPAATRQTTSTK
jgi:predicted NAD/FAD-dependent oxidoreductase